MADQPTVTLHPSVTMPQLGFGVWQVSDAEAVAAVATALQAGYRSIDTAAMYQNERGVGQAVRQSGLAREDVFVTSKLNNDAHGSDETLRAFDASLENLGFDYLDLYLIHWPLPRRDRYVDSWRAFAKLQADGRVRAIGVSNFQAAHLQRLIDETGVVPALNQIELHPYLVQSELRDFHGAHGIATEAWSPLGSGHGLLDDQVIVTIAEKYGKSAAQVALRWHLQLGNVVIPKSVTPSRIVENISVFDFELDPDDVEAITDLNRDERTGPNPDTFNP